MTTTLRPAEPERPGPDGARSRTYHVCVNGRPVGEVELSRGGRHGPDVGRIAGLAIDRAGRHRGRGTVAALAGEEVLRSWGCRLVEAAVPADAPYALRMAASLGYTERNRTMAKKITGRPRPLPPGSSARPMARGEYEPWLARGHEEYVAKLAGMGVPRDQAEYRAARSVEDLLPAGAPAPGTDLVALEHDGERVAGLWLRTAEPAWVLQVEVDAAHRGRGHGRSMMLVAENLCRAAGTRTVGLNVFATNTTALRLYESLGYATVDRHFTKPLC
ncbi:GNAT family N-acetyltransferase [Streptomyces sp. HPF1205]|uniref:GNAT family N-acetyltransferase n=1 Tax=Streptomyces sp. HPF1205 TaxID=2873262 RepID=UPI001CEDADFE|nr:GNAT family N-acetyltransferase [Streptomyces sp. HPF1205]